MKSKPKVVLAYSGGLDTSVMIPWLKDKHAAEVIAVTGDVGQGENMQAIKAKALASGASKAYVEDLKESFVKDYVFAALKAGALYEGKYPLATALSRPLLAQRIVEIAKQEGAGILAHGCTGKGNDQVRFETAFRTLAPEMRIVAPAREWEFVSREEEIAYAQAHGIPVEATKKSPFSIDVNLWGRSVECGVLEDPWQEPPEEAYRMTVSPAAAPDEPEYVEISFERGEPVALNDKALGPVALVEELNRVAGAHGVGRIDMLENRLVGIKSREVYEAPAAVVLHLAHQQLEDMVLDRETAHYKALLSHKYAEIVYYGLWFSPLREALDAFVGVTQRVVTGTVKVKLFKGSCTVVGRKSSHSLYLESLATYSAGDVFNRSAAAGFLELWALPTKVYAQVNGVCGSGIEGFAEAKVAKVG